MGRVAIGCLVAPFLLGAAGIAVAGIGLAVDSFSRSQTGAEVEGVIVDLIASTDADGDTLYQPVVAYTVDGVTYEVESRTRHGGALRPQVGEARTVLYDPRNPADAVLGGFWSLWLAPLLMVLLPLGLIGGALWLAVRSRRRSIAEGLEATSQQDPDASRLSYGSAAHGPGASSSASGDLPSGEAERRIDALFIGVEPSPMDDYGRVRYRVRARGEIDGELRRFYSGWLDDDPTLSIMKAGNRVPVWIDPHDPSRYRMVIPLDAG